MPGYSPEVIEQISQELAGQFTPRLQALGIDQEALNDDLGIIYEFNKIALGMLQEEPGIELPGSPQPIPLDEKILMQGVTLFAEGVYLAIVKCLEMSIDGDIKKHLLQNLAMDVYNQAKQVVASTYGQEATPEFQFTHEQQVELINQGAESALMFYIGEYERENGPIHVEEPPTRLLPKVEQAMVEDGVPLPVAAPPPVSQSAPAKPTGPTPHDKYGAVALLLTTLGADQRAKILRNFNVEEKELIAFYSYPQHIEQNLDVACVDKHLKRFKEMLKQGGSALKSNAYRGISQFAQQYPLQKLLSCVKDERPVVQRYIESHYSDRDLSSAGPDDWSMLGGGSSGAPKNRHLAELLPGRLEDILYRHLKKRLDPGA